MNIRNNYFLLAALVSAAIPVPALAGLGAAPTPIPAATAAVSAGAHAKATQRSPSVDGYTVNEIRTATGSTINEYVTAQGVVFAISWRSAIMPDLHELLGSYFPAFERASADSRSTGRRGPLNIDSPDLVLQSGGQMRNFRGRAYVPGLLPPNVSGADIQ